MVFGPAGNRRFWGSGRPRRPPKPVQKVRGFAPNLLKWFLLAARATQIQKNDDPSRPNKPCIKKPKCLVTLLGPKRDQPAPRPAPGRPPQTWRPRQSQDKPDIACGFGRTGRSVSSYSAQVDGGDLRGRSLFGRAAWAGYRELLPFAVLT